MSDESIDLDEMDRLAGAVLELRARIKIEDAPGAVPFAQYQATAAALNKAYDAFRDEATPELLTSLVALARRGREDTALVEKLDAMAFDELLHVALDTARAASLTETTEDTTNG